jgi:molecular chaperone GrpE
MKKNRTGSDSDSGRSGRVQRRSDAKRRAAAESGLAAPQAPHPQADGNGVDAAPTGAAGPPPGAAGGCSPDPQRASEPAAADAGGERIEDAAQADSATEQIDELNARIGALRNELLRKQADFENARKRLIRDKEEAIKFANAGLLVDLTGILDDFERAISSAANGRDFGTLHSGIELIEKQLLGTLERNWGLARFDSAGQPFDPERHEAIATEPSPEHREATVLEDYQKGFTLHGRVVRAARVRVATPVDEAHGIGGGDDPDLQAGPDGSG